MIWRRILVRSESSLAQLHDIIQIAFGWSDSHLHRFRIHGRDYGVSRPGGPGFAQDADQVRLADFQFRHNERFLYEYDFGDRGTMRSASKAGSRRNRGEATRSVSADNTGHRRKTAAAPGPSCNDAMRSPSTWSSTWGDWPNRWTLAISRPSGTMPKRSSPCESGWTSNGSTDAGSIAVSASMPRVTRAGIGREVAAGINPGRSGPARSSRRGLAGWSRHRPGWSTGADARGTCGPDRSAPDRSRARSWPRNDATGGGEHAW